MEISQLYVAGINYKKTDANKRGLFALSNERYNTLLASAQDLSLNNVFVLSTCNRTEIYGVAPDVDTLVHLLCSETEGNAETFFEMAYIKNGSDAIEHLFEVAAGLDSQILGDYEIVGQIKQSVKFSRERGCISAFMDRLVNTVLQSSKAIKTQTALSGGTVSVSFAAVQFLSENLQNAPDKKILLLGTGKIGRNTSKNLVDYLHTKNITLINRTEEKAEELANELDLISAPYNTLKNEIEAADVVIVATNCETPVLLKKDLETSAPKILIDLSIPNNIEPAAGELDHITLVNVDDLSKINDATLQKRQAEVPKAKEIIRQHMQEFSEWYAMRKNVPVIKAVKQKLMDMQTAEIFAAAHPNTGFSHSTIDSACDIQKVLNSMATKMRQQRKPGCNFIEAINDYISARVH